MAGITGTENPTRVLTAHSIIGDKVVNPAGENLGEIKDLQMDLSKGCIAYAVLDFGGFLGIGSKYFAVPWNAFTVDQDREHLILNVDKQALENAPGFDKDHWPDTNDATYYSNIDQYYSQYGSSRGTMGGGTMGSNY